MKILLFPGIIFSFAILPTPAHADPIPFMPDELQYAVLGLGNTLVTLGGVTTIQPYPFAITGANVGIASGGTLTAAPTVSVFGSVEFQDPQSSSPCVDCLGFVPFGGTQYGVGEVGVAASDLTGPNGLASTLAALCPSASCTDLGSVALDGNTANGTLTLAPGVYSADGLSLVNAASLELTAGGTYIFDVTGSFDVEGGSTIGCPGLCLGPELQPEFDDIIFNVLGLSSSITGSGAGSTINGVLLGVDQSISLEDGASIYGNVWGGGATQTMNITDSTVYAPVPEPSSWILLASGLAASAWRRRRRLQ
jgi:hypothetical protein